MKWINKKGLVDDWEREIHGVEDRYEFTRRRSPFAKWVWRIARLIVWVWFFFCMLILILSI